MPLTRHQAESLFKRHPEYSDVRVEIYDKREARLDSGTKETDAARSSARADLTIDLFKINAAAYLRLVDDLDFQEAYEVVLTDEVYDAWAFYAKTNRQLFEAGIIADTKFLQGLRMLRDYWIAEGHRRISERHRKASTALADIQQSSIEATSEHAERKKLAENYFAGFQQKIMVLDLCWAADEHYREWKRWLQEKSPIKNGSKPDLAFRAILQSGKRPIEYRRQERPPGWQ